MSESEKASGCLMLLISTSLLIAAPDTALAQDHLLKVDRSDPNLARKMKILLDQGREKSLLGNGAEPSLPMLGFPKSMENPTDREKSLSLNEDNGAALNWPACASKEAKVSTVLGDDGTWYTLNYDYGCIHLSVSGDRNNPRDFPGAKSLPKDLKSLMPSDSEPVESVIDEAGDAQNTNVYEVSFQRFGIPYTATIECFDDAQSYCQEKSARMFLIRNKLTLVGGRQ